MSSRVVALNDQEFLMSLGRTDLMKYNTVNKEWTLFLEWDEDPCYHLIQIDRQMNRLYFSNTNGSMIVKDLSTGLTIQKPSRAEHYADVEYGFVNANGTIYRLGGLKEQRAIWDKSHGCWNPSEVVHPYFAGHYLDMVSLIYVKSKNIILMLGGLARNVGQSGMWRFDIATSKWTHVETVEDDYHSTDAVLTSDEQHVIIVCGYRIDVLDIRDENDYKITGSMKLTKEFSDGEYHGFTYPVLMKRRETEVIALTSGWFRKLFHSEDHPAACPLDVLKLVDQFVCKEMLHLLLCNYTDSAVHHAVFHLTDILSSDSAEIPAPIELPGFSFPIPKNRRLPNTANEG